MNERRLYVSHDTDFLFIKIKLHFDPLSFTEQIFDRTYGFVPLYPGTDSAHCAVCRMGSCVCVRVFTLLGPGVSGLFVCFGSSYGQCEFTVCFLYSYRLMLLPTIDSSCLLCCDVDVCYWNMFALAPTQGPPDQRKLPGQRKSWPPLLTKSP